MSVSFLHGGHARRQRTEMHPPRRDTVVAEWSLRGASARARPPGLVALSPAGVGVAGAVVTSGKTSLEGTLLAITDAQRFGCGGVSLQFPQP